MSGASDELREFGDMIDAGQTSKIKEPEPSHWEFAKQRGLRYTPAIGDQPIARSVGDGAPTGPLTPGQVSCRVCRLDDRTRAASDPDELLCEVCRQGGDAVNGHQFHFTVFVQGSYRVGDGPYQDEPPREDDEPFGLTVRAWNLAAACRKAAATPLSQWTHAATDEALKGPHTEEERDDHHPQN